MTTRGPILTISMFPRLFLFSYKWCKHSAHACKMYSTHRDKAPGFKGRKWGNNKRPCSATASRWFTPRPYKHVIFSFLKAKQIATKRSLCCCRLKQKKGELKNVRLRASLLLTIPADMGIYNLKNDFWVPGIQLFLSQEAVLNGAPQWFTRNLSFY